LLARQAYYAKATLEDYHPELERPLVLLGNDLARLVRDHQPTHVIGCFDYCGPRDDNIRRAIFPPYKANRDDQPAAMKTLVPQAMRMFEALGVPVFQAPQHESDDVMAALTEWVKAQQREQQEFTLQSPTDAAAGTAMRVVIVSDDKDMLACVSAGDGEGGEGGVHVHVLNPRLREIYGPDEVFKKTGVRPDQFTCYQALTGDSADNVPGVTGIGPRTAARLLAAFGTLEDLYENLDKVAELPIRGAKTLGAKLEKQRDTAFVCREVVRLRSEVPLPGLERLTLHDFRYDGPLEDAEFLLNEATGGLGRGALQALRSIERGSVVRQRAPF
jgi:DNA polymerase I